MADAALFCTASEAADILDVFSFVLLYSCLALASLSDIRYRKIPNVLILLPAVSRLVALTLRGAWKDLAVCLASGLFILLLLWAAGVLAGHLVPGRTAKFGGGDEKLFFLAGLYFGLTGGLVIAFISCLFGLTAALILRKRRFPFAPCITAAFVLYALMHVL